MNNGIKEGIIYTRVSTHGQVTKGEGLESQRYSCEKLAKERGIKILEVFADKGVSGSSLYRPGLDRLTKFLRTRKMKPTWVFIDELDRFARLGVQNYHYLKDEVTKLGGKFISVKDDLESETAASRLIENFKVAIGGFEREHNQERVNTRMRVRINQGFWVFHAPPGYVYSHHLEGGKILVPDPLNTPLIQDLFNQFSEEFGPSLKELRHTKSFRGLKNPRTLKPYLQRPETLRGILENKLYIGKVEFLKWDIAEMDGMHEAIISDETFEEVQNRLSNKRKKSYRHISIDEFPLKGDVICGNCKTKLVASFSTGRSKKYPYYRCKTKNSFCDIQPKNLSRDSLHNQFLSLIDGAKIKKEVLVMADRIIEDLLKEKSKHHSGIQMNKENLIKDLERKKARQIKKILSVSHEDIIKQLEEEISSIDNEMKVLRKEMTEDYSLEDFKLSSNLFFKDPKKYWIKGSVKQKKILYDFVFDKEIEVMNGKVGTAPYSLPYRLLSTPVIKKDGMVELGGIEPPTSCVPRKRSPS